MSTSPPPRDALIFLSGLHREDLGESVDLAAARFVAALESEARTVSAQFHVGEARDERYGFGSEKHKTRVTTVFRKQDGANTDPVPLFDIYGLDYRETLVGDAAQARPILHLLTTIALLISNAHRLLAPGGRSKTDAEKWQVRFGWAAYGVVFLYLCLMLTATLGPLLSAAVPDSPTQAATIASAETEAKQQEQSLGSPGVEASAMAQLSSMVDWTHGWLGVSVEYAQVVVVWVTAIGLFLKFDLKSWIDRNGLAITAVSDYLETSNRSQVVADQFSALLNHVGERSTQYRHVHVVGYSFGSIIALDSLFPVGHASEIFRRIHTLVTVGCPFDFVRTYWPKYFERRSQLHAVPAYWLNIYAPADVLGSNFEDEARPSRWARWLLRKQSSEPKPTGLDTDGGLRRPDKNQVYGNPQPLEEYSRFQKLFLIGFTMHRQYWEDRSAGCYRNIVAALYRNDSSVLG